jgi:hypothetical protein
VVSFAVVLVIKSQDFVQLNLIVSIARRLQDPLAELVKIDPKNIGVGMYQVCGLPATKLVFEPWTLFSFMKNPVYTTQSS